jgi:hypothetical protein
VTDSTRVQRPTVATGCIEDRPRTSFAEVRWTTPRNLLPDSATLDYTVYKDGFTTARYATLGTQTAEPRMQMLFKPDVELVAMTIRGVSTRRAGDTTIVRVERLDPGVNYIWRVRTRAQGQWIVGLPTRVQAPTCVSDEPQQPR